MVEHRHYEQVYEIHKLRKSDKDNGHISEMPRSMKMENEPVCEIHKKRIEDDISSDDGYYGLSPPPPYSKDDLIGYEDKREVERRRSICYSPIEVCPRIEYNDVGEEINVTIAVIPNQEIGLTILSAKALTPSWPAILDIIKESPAWKASPELKIGDQIKEIHGIPTENLKYSDILSLFSKATDRLHLILRRGVEPTKRQFDWFKYPFLSVSKDIDEMTISYTSNLQKLYEYEIDPEPRFHTFVKEQQNESDELKRFKETEVSVSKDRRFRHFRSLSASAPDRDMFLIRQRQRRKTVRENVTISEKLRRPSGSFFKNTGSRSIITEVEMRRLRSDSRTSSGIGEDMSRKSSQSSLNSSTTTISSFASSNNIEQQNCYTNFRSENAESADSITNDPFTRPPQTIDQNNDFTRTPANKLRDSFRKKLKYKNNSAIMEQPIENTLNVTVWIPDRRKFGIKLGGGCVSPYGDSNICIMEVKKTGTAYKVLRTGDEILEIDGKLTTGMDVFQVNNIVKSLEGNYVEMKIFRPFKI